jgi:AcrR family transcriptional regulator
MKRDKRRKDTKKRLFSAALDLFAEMGMEAVSIRDIAGSVGISAAAFYNHFKSKDALLQAVYDFYKKTLIVPASKKNADDARTADLSDPVRFLTLSIEKFRAAVENPMLEKLGRIIVMEQTRNKTAAEISFRDRQKVVRFMEDMFGTAVKRGLFKGGNARILGRMFGYAQLGIMQDNVYYRYMKNMKTDEVYRRQNDELKRFLTALLQRR